MKIKARPEAESRQAEQAPLLVDENVASQTTMFKDIDKIQEYVKGLVLIRCPEFGMPGHEDELRSAVSRNFEAIRNTFRAFEEELGWLEYEGSRYPSAGGRFRRALRRLIAGAPSDLEL